MSAAGSSGHADSSDARVVAAAASQNRPGLEHEVRDALSHVHDPGRLQSHLLTRFLKGDASPRPSSLGRALRQALLDAIEALRPPEDLPSRRHASRAYQILRLRYVEALEVSQVLDRLSVSESLYYLELQRAIEGLSAVLWERWGLGEASETPGRLPKPPTGDREGREVGSVVPRGRVEVVSEPLTNLPVQLTSFVGREREMAEVSRLLGANRLLTLTGAGGCGKTRLALQVAADLLAKQPAEYPDGVWLVELAALSDPELVPQTVAITLGLRDASGEPILTTLQSYLKPKRLLLVLDNCEHLLDASARLTDSLLRACPELRVLATSREALGIAGETSYRVPSLSLPDLEHLPVQTDLAEGESVRLFLERARAAQPSFQFTGQDVPAVAQICLRLDGMPLAIELAAARVRGLTIDGIARHLDDRFRLLTGGSRTALRRQQTLRATIDWSYDLLSPPERTLFRRLAVFAGGWSLEAAEEVCSGEDSQATVWREDVLDLLLRLVDRSLVVAEQVARKERYRLPETIRQYAVERISDSGEGAEVRDRHRDWCPHLVASLEVGGFVGEDCGALLDQMELEHDNLRAALAWCLETNPGAGLRLAAGQTSREWAGVWALWMLRGYPTEGRRWLSDLLDAAPEATPTRAVALAQTAWLAGDQGDSVEAARLAEEAVAVASKARDSASNGVALLSLGTAARDQADYARARTLLEEARAIGLSVGAADLTGRALHLLGVVASAEGNLEEAEVYLEEALSLCRAGGLDRFTAYVLPFMAGLAVIRRGDYDRARAYLEESVAILRKARDLTSLGLILPVLGFYEGLVGDYARGVTLFRESLRLQRRQGHRPRLVATLYLLGNLEVHRAHLSRGVRLLAAAEGTGPSEWRTVVQAMEPKVERMLGSARVELGEEAFARAWAEGQTMTLNEAVEFALQDEGEGDV